MPGPVIRDFDPPRDWREFALLNYRTFRDSVPPDEPVNEEDFKRHHHWLLGHFAPSDPGRNQVYVAEFDGRYAGHCWIGTQTDFFTRRVDPWIFDLSVKPEFRRKGIARALHAKAEQWVRAQGLPWLGLQVMAHNQAAAGLYASLGYQPRAISMKKKV